MSPKGEVSRSRRRSYFLFNDTATTEIYTLSLHDALPISNRAGTKSARSEALSTCRTLRLNSAVIPAASSYARSEEHTSELQSRQYLVCRLLLEKKQRKDDAQTVAAGAPALRQVQALDQSL